jgi:hypothetical protein
MVDVKDLLTLHLKTLLDLKQVLLKLIKILETEKLE